MKLYILSNLCTDVRHPRSELSAAARECITLCFGGTGPPVSVCGLSTLHVEPPPLLQFLEPECKPIASKSRKSIKNLSPLKLMNYLKRGN